MFYYFNSLLDVKNTHTNTAYEVIADLIKVTYIIYMTTIYSKIFHKNMSFKMLKTK